MARNPWKTSTTGFFIGLGVGASLAILFAPKSGEETRDEIVGGVRDVSNEVAAQGIKMGRRVQRTLDDARDQAKEAAEAMGQAYREAKTTSL